METVLVKYGNYRNQIFQDQLFRLVAPVKRGKKGLFVTVDGAPADRPGQNIRIKLGKEDDVISFAQPNDLKTKVDPEETDNQIMDRMRQKFEILDDMTMAACQGTVRGMVVTGPPGVGKSFGVEKVLEEARSLNKMAGINQSQIKIDVEKGSASPVGLYCLLYEYAAKGSVLVLDDSDTILYDEQSLNMLKAALDSGKSRKLSWRSESHALTKADVPNFFKFEGSILFITNLNFEKSRGKIAEHLKAIMSRCHYLDMAIGTTREKFLRCQQIVNDGMLDSYHFDCNEEAEILDFIYENKDRLRELSLRMVTKIADLRQMNPDKWRVYAENTCVRSSK